ncbi:hypothetical protein [Burkholderia cenocepacia]|uniref:hypothetical protein n=1 Tax=Burkholderia cenocepacia TaxID=95486 RepID=UPI0008477671|nr:hypothetical protein [Burkholderia cenocepacia]
MSTTDKSRADALKDEHIGLDNAYSRNALLRASGVANRYDAMLEAAPQPPAPAAPLAMTDEQRAPASAPVGLTDAERDVLAERRRQVEGEGWTPEHDDEHDMGEMAHAAAWYAVDPIMRSALDERGLSFWPWAQEWWKSTTPRRDLVKAGALILAEIERIDRALLDGAKQ